MGGTSVGVGVRTGVGGAVAVAVGGRSVGVALGGGPSVAVGGTSVGGVVPVAVGEGGAVGALAE
jgi:hypothetical protein